MTNHIKIKKGLDIRLKGEAAKIVSEVDSGLFAIKPTDFPGVFPKMLVKEGDTVSEGTALFFDKHHANIQFTSPVSGVVKAIVRGAKRKLLEVQILADQAGNAVDFGAADPSSLDREVVIDKLLKSGVFPLIRQRPYNVIADPAEKPKCIAISGFDTAPLAPDYNLIIDGEEHLFQVGINALAKLTDGKIYLNVDGESTVSSVFEKAKGVELTRFSGKHPAGNVGTQISKLAPINKGETVWTLRPESVLTIGRLFETGKYNSEKIIAVAGPEVEDPHYFRVKQGASVEEILKVVGLKSDHVRVISGNVLSGTTIEKRGFLGAYANMISVITEGDFYRFFGWIEPGLNRFSFNRTFTSWMTPKRKFSADTNLNGGRRAFVFTGDFERVFPFDIYPLMLIKAILAEDIDKMEELGIYEVIEEDFALCEYIDVSKNDIQQIVRQGLDMLRKEMI